VSDQAFPGEVYSYLEARQELDTLLKTMRKLDIPIALLWTFNERARTLHEPVLWPDRQPEVIRMLQSAQAEARRGIDSSPPEIRR